jgi:SAM-dependent methyltransferase
MTNDRSEFDLYAEGYNSLVERVLPPGVGSVAKFARVKVWHAVGEAGRRGLDVRSLNVLDAGCGTGTATALLKSFCRQVTGLDVSRKSLEIASANNPDLHCVHYDGTRFPFSDGHFDLCLAMCVVHHIHEPGRRPFFQELFRVLRPGGLAVIFEHNPLNPATRYVVSKCPLDQNATMVPEPLCRRLLMEAGFRDAESKFFLFAPVEWKAWLRWERRFLSRIPWGAQYFCSAAKML